MFRKAGEACSISRTSARLRAELSSQSRVSEPPSPARAVHLPAEGAVRLRDLDDAAGLRADEGRVEPPLRLRALGHGPAEACEVARVERVARAGRGAPQVDDGRRVRPGVSPGSG